MIELPVGTWVYPVKKHEGKHTFAAQRVRLTKKFVVNEHVSIRDPFAGLADKGFDTFVSLNERPDRFGKTRNFRLFRFPKMVQDPKNRHMGTIGFIFDTSAFKESPLLHNIRFEKTALADGTTEFCVEASEWAANGYPSPITGYPLSLSESATERNECDIVDGDIIATHFTLSNGNILTVLND